MTEWREVTLAEVCERVDYGYTASAADDPDLPRFLRITDIVKPQIDWRGVPGCPIDAADFKKFALAEGDIVVARTGATVGYAKRIKSHPDAVFASYLVRFRHAQDVVPGYLAAVVESRAYKEWVRGNAGGAAQPNANARVLGAYPFALPSAETQRSVAEVLDAIDDLIENNRRRVEVLEEMARTIYREWFVHFRFPGHEDATFVDSDLGPIPEGWRGSTCGKELDFVGGGTPSKKESEFWEAGTVDWFTPSDLTKSKRRYPRSSGLQITEKGLARSSAKLFPAGTVMMTSRATLGVLAIATGPATTNQGFISVLPDDRWPSNFIREFLDDSAEGLAAIASGATFKEITKGSFKTFPFVVPAQHVLDEFREATEPLEQSVQRIEESVEHLTGIRDLLLPKLVTGRIDVSDLDLDAVVEKAGV